MNLNYLKGIEGMTLYDFMMSLPPFSFDGDIVGDGDYEYPSVVGFGRTSLTKAGHEKWDKILKQYKIEKVTYDRYKYPYISVVGINPNDVGARLNKFVTMLAYGNEEYLNEEGETMKGFKTTKPQSECPFEINFNKML